MGQLTGITALDAIQQHPFEALLCLSKRSFGKTCLFFPRHASFIEPLQQHSPPLILSEKPKSLTYNLARRSVLAARDESVHESIVFISEGESSSVPGWHTPIIASWREGVNKSYPSETPAGRSEKIAILYIAVGGWLSSPDREGGEPVPCPVRDEREPRRAGAFDPPGLAAEGVDRAASAPLVAGQAPHDFGNGHVALPQHRKDNRLGCVRLRIFGLPAWARVAWLTGSYQEFVVPRHRLTRRDRGVPVQPQDASDAGWRARCSARRTHRSDSPVP